MRACVIEAITAWEEEVQKREERRGKERRGEGRRGEAREGEERRGEGRRGEERGGEERGGEERGQLAHRHAGLLRDVEHVVDLLEQRQEKESERLEANFPPPPRAPPSAKLAGAIYSVKEERKVKPASKQVSSVETTKKESIERNAERARELVTRDSDHRGGEAEGGAADPDAGRLGEDVEEVRGIDDEEEG
eukprot:502420-Hanusia_phi.AAC.1